MLQITCFPKTHKICQETQGTLDLPVSCHFASQELMRLLKHFGLRNLRNPWTLATPPEQAPAAPGTNSEIGKKPRVPWLWTCEQIAKKHAVLQKNKETQGTLVQHTWFLGIGLNSTEHASNSVRPSLGNGKLGG